MKNSQSLKHLAYFAIITALCFSSIGCNSQAYTVVSSTSSTSSSDTSLNISSSISETQEPSEPVSTESTEPEAEATAPSTSSATTEAPGQDSSVATNQPAVQDPVATQPTAPSSPAETTPPATEPPHTHSYSVSGTIPAGCESQGYSTYSCSCGSSYKDNYTAATGHNYTSQVIAPTYEAGGYTLHTCSVCNSSYTSDETPKLEAPSLDYDAASAYGNQYALEKYGASHGWAIDTSLNFDNAGFNFPYTGSVEGIIADGGQAVLNRHIAGKVDALFESLSGRASGGVGYAVNCHVYERDGVVYFYVYYG